MKELIANKDKLILLAERSIKSITIAVEGFDFFNLGDAIFNDIATH